MSQQGIFSIAPDGQAPQQNGSPASQASPFTAVQEADDRPSPFVPAAEAAPASPFQTVQADTEPRGGIPQPRPEGQPPAMKTVQDAPGQADFQPAEPQQAAFEAVPENTGGPFQMQGFSEQATGQFTEAAPVARGQQDSPFVVAPDEQPDYEAAKAELEPQQDFAAVGQGYAAPQTQPVVQQDTAPVVAAPVQSQPVATAEQPSVSTMQQLELRAIFGVNHLLDQGEIIQRARTLPGVRNVALMGQQEASALSNFRQAMRQMGLGDSQDLKLTAGGGDVDFLTEGETTIAVVHEGNYAPGVQETLIIVARELGKLS